MKHLGDITAISGYEAEIVDCICGGSPCQDLSIAGKRKGLAGERSGLFMEQVRIIKEMRENDRQLHGKGANEPVRPRFAIWENVPGALSSNKGEDFRAVLEEFIRVKEGDFTVPGCKKWARAGAIIGDSWSVAWRVMDARYWGVPQRRRRIAVLVDYESQDAANILLCDDMQPCGMAGNSDTDTSIVDNRPVCGQEVRSVSEGLLGNLKPCIPPWKGIASDPERSTLECNTLKLRHTGSDTRGGSRSIDTERPLRDTCDTSGSDAFLTDRNSQ